MYHVSENNDVLFSSYVWEGMTVFAGCQQFLTGCESVWVFVTFFWLDVGGCDLLCLGVGGCDLLCLGVGECDLYLGERGRLWVNLARCWWVCVTARWILLFCNIFYEINSPYLSSTNAIDVPTHISDNPQMLHVKIDFKDTNFIEKINVSILVSV